MNILFLTVSKIWSINEDGIYTDLLREFRKKGDTVYIVSPIERDEKKETQLIQEANTFILKVKIGNIQKTNLVEKGINTLLIERKYLYSIEKYFKNISFDLILYPTPPVTFVNVVQYIKKRDSAKTYLLLKDIFPQNSVDIEILSTKGVKGVLYNYFRKKEIKLYSVSDYIGCMSEANVEYLLQHNPWIPREKVEICPNSISVVDRSISNEKRKILRKRFGISEEKTVFIYGGNLGKPQGIDFLIKCLGNQKNSEEAFFLIIGDGTEFLKISSFLTKEKFQNVILKKRMQKKEYEELVSACDVGLLFLDYRFTIPNFPSRLLSYMQSKIPVISCTDEATDIGRVIEKGEFGWSCRSNDVSEFENVIKNAINADRKKMGEKAFDYLDKHYNVEDSYKIITKHLILKD